MLRFSQLDIIGYINGEIDTKKFLRSLECFCRSMQTDADIPKALTEGEFIRKIVHDALNPNEDIQIHAFGVIFCLAYKGTHILRLTLHEAQATVAAVNCILNNPCDRVLQSLLEALVGLLRLEAAKDQFMQLCGLTPMLEVMADSDKKDSIIGSATKVIRMLIQNKPSTCKLLLEDGGLEILARVIRNDDEKCVENGCFALQVLYFRAFDQVLDLGHFNNEYLASRLVDIIQSEGWKQSSKFYACCCLVYFVRFNPSALELCLRRKVRVDVEEMRGDEQVGLDTEELQNLLDELKTREDL